MQIEGEEVKGAGGYRRTGWGVFPALKSEHHTPYSRKKNGYTHRSKMIQRNLGGMRSSNIKSFMSKHVGRKVENSKSKMCL